MQTLMLLGFGIYFVILSLIAIIATKKALKDQDHSSFMVGNRSINYWLTALSAHASDMSDWLFMAYPAAIFVGGLLQSWIAIGLVIGMFCNWHFVAPKLRIMTEKYNVFTLSSFFEKRFNDKSGILRIVSAILSLFFITIYIAAGLKGIGFLMQAVFGVSYSTAIIGAIFMVLAYTLIGGFIAVAWVDAFQAIFLLLMILIVPILAYIRLDSFQDIINVANAKNISLSLLPDYSLKTIINAILISLGWGLGYFGMPHILAKFMGISDPRELNKSKYIGITWQIIILAAATAVGIVALPYFVSGLANKELVFVELVKMLFHPLSAGLVLCGIVAATLSTIDSQVLVLASLLTQDFYKNIFKDAKIKNLVWVFRINILITSLISACIALVFSHDTIMSLVAYAWMGLGPTFGPLVIAALYGENKVNKYGAFAGIVSGGLIAALWNPVLQKFIAYPIPAMVPAFFSSLILIFIVSAIFKKR
ncbi:sodium/proline symporter [Candidatus Dependentiae bacterium]|nr:sodium/proline symporter [Candidatus Dependentiae bacterium]